MDSHEQLRKMFEEAAQLAGTVPETMQGVAFGRAIDALESIRERLRTDSRDTGKPNPKPPQQEAVDDPVPYLLAHLDRTRYPQVTHERSVADNAMRVLKAARDEHKIDGLTPGQLAVLLKEKFRLSTTSNAVNMALGRAGSKVDRIPAGGSFLYRLMAPGEAYLQAQS